MGRAKHRNAEAPAVAARPDASGSDASAPEASIGRYLARERELRGISLDELAELTKLPRRSLERLEAGAYDQRSDGFARGFARTVSQALGLPRHETLTRMSPETFASSRGRKRLRGLPFLWHLQIAVVASILLICATLLTFWVRGDVVEPEPLVYRRDSVRALWLRERDRLPLRAVELVPTEALDAEGLEGIFLDESLAAEATDEGASPVDGSL